MDFFDVGWAGSIAAGALVGLAVVVAISLAEGRDRAAVLAFWRFVLAQLSGRKLLGADEQPSHRERARQLSDVLRIPIVDAELSLELSEAFFHPTDDPELNGQALELLRSPIPRNEDWRARAVKCCQKLRALKPATRWQASA